MPARRTRRWLLTAAAVTLLFCLLSVALYPVLDRGYQRNMDPIRRRHADAIVRLVMEYAEKTGHLPFEDSARESPFRVLIGHSVAEEDHFARDPVLPRGHGRARSRSLEKMLSEGLGRPIRLPRDPQTVPTYAPNVYVYFVSGDQFTVASHLYEPHPKAVAYEWGDGTFYSYAPTYGRTQKGPDDPVGDLPAVEAER